MMPASAHFLSFFEPQILWFLIPLPVIMCYSIRKSWYNRSINWVYGWVDFSSTVHIICYTCIESILFESLPSIFHVHTNQCTFQVCPNKQMFRWQPRHVQWSGLQRLTGGSTKLILRPPFRAKTKEDDNLSHSSNENAPQLQTSSLCVYIYHHHHQIKP